MTKKFTLKQKYNIKLKKHFEYLFSNSSRIENSYVRIYYAKAFCGTRKIALVASKKIGGAVYRNYCKRRLREIFRHNQYAIVNDYDFIFVAKKRTGEADFNQLNEEIIKLLRKHNCLQLTQS